MGTVFAVTACADHDQQHSYQLALNVAEQVQLDNAKAIIKLYGVNRMAAGNKATLLAEEQVSITELPTAIQLVWPTDAHKLITEPSVPDASEADYYFNIMVDTNNDGQLCQGDLRQDFAKTPFTKLTGKPEQSLSYQLTPVTETSCNAH